MMISYSANRFRPELEKCFSSSMFVVVVVVVVVVGMGQC